MYKIHKNQFGVDISIEIVGERTFIPFDPANTDYQAYLAWLAEGNEPLPAEDQIGQNTPIQE